MKVIIIGATSGIGRELAKLYVRAGHSVGITGRRKELLESFQQEFQGYSASGGGSISIACFDVTESQNIASIEALVKTMGGLDLLLYNSGFGDPSPSLDWAIDKKTIAINVNGFTEIINWGFHFFMAQGRGHIAATSSIAANRGNSFAPAYSASKAFISCYLEGLSLKANRMKIPISVTDLQPGFVRTKEINVKGQFWVVSLDKAALQIFKALEEKRFRVYVSKRWWLIAKLMRVAPRFIYEKVG